VVARGGIESPTRGFSVRRSGSTGATNPKTGKGFLRGRPNRPAQPNLSRTGSPKTWRNTGGPDPVQRVSRVATERLPSLAPNGARQGSASLARHATGIATLHGTDRSVCTSSWSPAPTLPRHSTRNS